MKILQHRRHSLKTLSGQNISPRGVELARQVGSTLGRFDYVATSSLTRTRETAEAMGFQVNEQLEELALIPSYLAQELAWEGGFASWYDGTRPGSVGSAYVEELRDLHLRLLSKVPENGRLLIVSHSGVVEASAIACVSASGNESLEVRGWGELISYCEGFEVRFENGVFRTGKPLRI
jgi:broad specificity phosphatase PhoE